MCGGWLESWDGTLCAELLPCPLGRNGLPSLRGAGGCTSLEELLQLWTQKSLTCVKEIFYPVL